MPRTKKDRKSRLRRSNHFAGRRITEIKDRQNCAPRIGKRVCRGIGIIIVGRDDSTLARQHSKAPKISANRLGKHHAGTVIIGKSQWPFKRARREHDPLCTDMPQPLCCAVSRLSRLDQMLNTGHHALIPSTRCRGARQHAATFRFHCRPCLANDYVVFVEITQQTAAKLTVLLDQQHAFAVHGSAHRSRQPGRPTAHNQHIAKRGTVFITVGVGLGRRLAQPSRAANEFFVEHPKLWWAKEGLVIKARHENRAAKHQNGAEIELQTGPTVLAFRNQPLINEHIRRPRIGRHPRALSHCDKRVRLLNASRHNPTRAVIFETPRD